MITTDNISTILGNYQSISLERLEKVPLVNRQDTKTFFHIDQLPQVLKVIQPFYFCLEIDKRRMFRYESLYLDTPDRQVYLNHHNERLKRYKIRYRRYTDSDLTYFEVKTKTNKNRTIKRRVVTKGIQEDFGPKSRRLIEEQTPYRPEQLSPSLWTGFKRISMISKDLTEKATIDLDIHYKFGDEMKALDGLVIIEVKQKRYNPKSELLKALREQQIYPRGISKYCLGSLLFQDSLKYNRFKPRLRQIEQVTGQTLLRA